MSSVSISNLKFRKLTTEDIPNVLEITDDIWDWDYLPIVIERWINDPKCYAFGAFLDSKLIAVANVRFLTPESVWLEGGRVRLEYQKKGIGIEITKHCLEYAKEHGTHVAQYDTSNTNEGSIALAQRFGLKKIREIPVFYNYLDDPAFKDIKIKDVPEIKQISPDEAFDFAKTIPNEPENYLCTGWSFVPFQREILPGLHGKWFKFMNAFILVLNSTLSSEILKQGRLWIIVYGDTKSASELIQGYLFKIEKENIFQNLKEVDIFCPQSLLKELEKLGLKRIRREQGDDRPLSVFLYEKILN